MKILEREIGSIEYAENQTRTLPLPRNYAYRCLDLVLIAKIEREAGSVGEVKDSAPAQLIKNIAIRANGRDVIKNYDMESLHRLNQMRHGTRPFIDSEGLNGFTIIATPGTVHMVAARIEFEMWDAIRPIDTLLDSAGLATLELIVTWGTGLDIMNDATDCASVTVNEAALYVSAVESVGVPPGTAFMTNKEYMIRSQVTATSNRHQIFLPVSNLYRSIVLKTHSDGDQVNTILPFNITNQNAITLQSGTEVFKYRIAGFLQACNRLDFSMEVPEIISDAAALNHRLEEQSLEGYYILEFVKDGRLTECLDTSRLSSLELNLDVVSVGDADFIDVYLTELIRPPVAVPA
ncbi:hypothetical protein ES705_10540 [subsurface metagenome]